MANLRSKTLDFRGLDSSIIIILRGGWNYHVHSEHPRSYVSTNLSWDNISNREIGRELRSRPSTKHRSTICSGVREASAQGYQGRHPVDHQGVRAQTGPQKIDSAPRVPKFMQKSCRVGCDRHCVQQGSQMRENLPDVPAPPPGAAWRVYFCSSEGSNRTWRDVCYTPAALCTNREK